MLITRCYAQEQTGSDFQSCSDKNIISKMMYWM